MIDWTQPIETTETPPRPVRVLATDRPNPDRPIVVMRDDGQVFTVGSDGIGNPQGYANGTYGRITLRNVAPPEPEPVLIEGWVNLVKASTAYEGGTYWIIRNGAVWQTKDAALSEAHKMPDVVGTAFIRLMSDGSPVAEATPVPGEDDPLRYGVCETCVEKAVKRCDELVAERDSLKAEVERLTQHAYLLEISEGDLERDRNNLKAEVERLNKANLRLLGEIGQMRPVVDAAVAWASWAQYNPPLLEAVRAYQNTPKKTAEEAVANVAKMMGSVKSCNNCRHDKNGVCTIEGPFSFDPDEDCMDWEAKND